MGATKGTSQEDVLLAMWSREGRFTAQSLGELFSISGSAMSYHLKRLEREGFVVCVESHRFVSTRPHDLGISQPIGPAGRNVAARWGLTPQGIERADALAAEKYPEITDVEVTV